MLSELSRTHKKQILLGFTYEIPRGFPGSSPGKESTCNAGDLGSILVWEDPLDEGMATLSSILAWRISMDRGAWQATVHRISKSQT